MGRAVSRCGFMPSLPLLAWVDPSLLSNQTIAPVGQRSIGVRSTSISKTFPDYPQLSAIIRHSCMLLAGISLVKHRFPIKDFGNDESYNIRILYVLFYYGWELYVIRGRAVSRCGFMPSLPLLAWVDPSLLSNQTIAPVGQRSIGVRSTSISW
jgi:hypothetical protein